MYRLYTFSKPSSIIKFFTTVKKKNCNIAFCRSFTKNIKLVKYYKILCIQQKTEFWDRKNTWWGDTERYLRKHNEDSQCVQWSN